MRKTVNAAILASVILAGQFVFIFTASGQSLPLPSGPRLPNPIELPPGTDLSAPTGQRTLDVVQSWNITETRFKPGRAGLLACSGVPRGGIGPDAVFSELAEDQLGIGYINTRSGGRRRCRDATGRTYHGAATFELQPIYDAQSDYAIRMGGNYTTRLKSVTVRLERKRTSVEPHRRCIIGRRAPLALITLDTSRSSIPRGSEGSPDVQFEEGAYTTIDGEPVGFGERYRAIAAQGSFDEERGSDESTTVFWTANAEAIDRMNERNALPDSILMLSVKNNKFNSRRSCFAAYGNIRLNMTYEFVPSE